jgi:hypothetical protein
MSGLTRNRQTLKEKIDLHVDAAEVRNLVVEIKSNKYQQKAQKLIFKTKPE